MAHRIQSLDVLRGFVLAGILYANIPGLARTAFPAAGSLDDRLMLLGQYGFEQRFFPIFSFLFGVGFSIFGRNAESNGFSARTLLVRRFVVLIVLGLLHQRLQPGEALLIYGIFGLALVPFVTAPVPVLLALGGAALIVGLVVSEFLVVPAMFFLGAAVAKVGYFDHPSTY